MYSLVPYSIFEVFHEHAQRYGPVFSVKIGRETIVVVAGYKVIPTPSECFFD